MRLSLSIAILASAVAASATPLHAQDQPLHAQDQGGPAWESAQPVELVLSNFKFTPRTLILHRGQVYRLHLVNNGSGGHSFSAPAFFARAHIAPEDAMAVEEGGKVELAKGEALDIRVIPLTAGVYRVKCTHFLHAAFGMTGSITVD